MKIGWLSVGTLLLVLTVGCAPELAKTPYGPTEDRWAQYLKKAYPGWEPPQTMPPLTESQTLPEVPESDETLEVDVDTVTLDIDRMDVIVPEEKMPVAEAPQFETYTVQKGDNLWKISKKFYKTGKEWKKIQAANPELISDPGKLKPGMELKIPK